MSDERRPAAAVLRGRPPARSTSRAPGPSSARAPGPPSARTAGPSSARPPGRPPGTSPRALELIALRLFAGQGFDHTTVEQIAAAAGVSRRTFFRYYDSKTSVLWSEFDREVTRLREVLETMPGELPVMAAVRRAVVMVNHYRAGDVPELRTRMQVIGSAPELAASAAVHYDAWERAISDFAARRSGQPEDSLYPLAVGRATLAACRAAFDRWAARADADLVVYLDAALGALQAGFADEVLAAEPAARHRQAVRPADARP